MPGPAKGSKAAHDRAVKAAETRRRNKRNRTIDELVSEYPGMAEVMRYERAAPVTRKLRSVGSAQPRKKKAPAFPKSYHATPTRHVTRNLKLKQTPAKVKHPYKLPTSRKAVHALSNIELQRQFNYWYQVPGKDLPKRRNTSYVIDELKQEMHRRARSTYGDLPRIKEHRARRGVRKQRGGK